MALVPVYDEKRVNTDASSLSLAQKIGLSVNNPISDIRTVQVTAVDASSKEDPVSKYPSCGGTASVAGGVLQDHPY